MVCFELKAARPKTSSTPRQQPHKICYLQSLSFCLFHENHFVACHVPLRKAPTPGATVGGQRIHGRSLKRLFPGHMMEAVMAWDSSKDTARNGHWTHDGPLQILSNLVILVLFLPGPKHQAKLVVLYSEAVSSDQETAAVRYTIWYPNPTNL